MTVGNLRELAIARKYSTEWQVMQVFLDVPANTTLTVTWNPPSDKVFLFQYWIAGEMKISDDFSYEVWWDGTRAGDYTNQGAIIDTSGYEIPLKIARHEVKTVLKNSMPEIYTFDVIIFGFNIHESLLDEFIEEVTGRKQQATLERIERTLLRIERLLGEVRRMRG